MYVIFSYDVMKSCWNLNPDRRPTFADLSYKMSVLHSNTSDPDYISIQSGSLESNQNSGSGAPVGDNVLYFQPSLFSDLSRNSSESLTSDAAVEFSRLPYREFDGQNLSACSMDQLLCMKQTEPEKPQIGMEESSM